MSGLVKPLMAGPLDVIGDVHGEIDALQALLERLGYDREGVHPRGRHLVFVGDLCDRGPDSPAVVRVVRGLVESGLAQCILGNHELNVLRGERKHGNHWFFGDDDPKHVDEFGPSAHATAAEAMQCWEFFARLPVALERPDLRIVHAAWWADAIAACRRASSALEAFEEHELAAELSDEGKKLAEQSRSEKQRYRDALSDRSVKFSAPLPGIAEHEQHRQMSNPIKVVTSGIERVTQRPFFVGGKWRFVERVRWWEAYRERVPVIFGHYWRWWNAADQAGLSKGEPNMFEGDAPDAWLTGDAGDELAMCVDYSVGSRYQQRLLGKQSGFCGAVGGAAVAGASIGVRYGSCVSASRGRGLLRGGDREEHDG